MLYREHTSDIVIYRDFKVCYVLGFFNYFNIFFRIFVQFLIFFFCQFLTVQPNVHVLITRFNM